MHERRQGGFGPKQAPDSTSAPLSPPSAAAPGYGVIIAAMSDTAPPSPAPAAPPLPTGPRLTVFFISDGTGITAETFGNSILSQFAIKARHVRRPFIDTTDKAHQVVREINHTAELEARKPVVFVTLVNPEILAVV